MRATGLEPVREYSQRFLRPQRLPFRHARIRHKKTEPVGEPALFFVLKQIRPFADRGSYFESLLRWQV